MIIIGVGAAAAPASGGSSGADGGEATGALPPISIFFTLQFEIFLSSVAWASPPPPPAATMITRHIILILAILQIMLQTTIPITGAGGAGPRKSEYLVCKIPILE